MDQSPAGSSPTSWRAHVATAVTTGVVTTCLPVQRWSRPARWSLHGGMATLGAATMALALRRPQTLRGLGVRGGSDEPIAPLPTAVVAGAFGALVLGASRGGQAGDEWVERRLAARGVRRPRLWMGMAAAGLSLAMSVSDTRRDARRAERPSPTGEMPDEVPKPEPRP